MVRPGIGSGNLCGLLEPDSPVNPGGYQNQRCISSESGSPTMDQAVLMGRRYGLSGGQYNSGAG